jgi:hypothetical protein
MNQKPIVLLEYPPVVSLNKLVKDRGWTDAMVRKHLGPPDALAVNPFRGVDRPVRVYLLRRVERAERRAEVIAGLQRAAEALRLREMIEDGSIDVLRNKLADDLAAVPIAVTVISIEDLRNRAHTALSHARAEQGRDPLGLSESELPPMVLARYAREHLVDHASIADHFEHLAEPLQVDYLLKGRIDAAVIKAYPCLQPLASVAALSDS